MAVISEQYPYLRLEVKVRDVNIKDYFYIDTGFDGGLILPRSFAEDFGEYDYVSRWTLGNGSLVEAEDYLGEARVVEVTEVAPVRVTCLGDEFIVGRGILDGLKVTLYYGKRVEAER